MLVLDQNKNELWKKESVFLEWNITLKNINGEFMF